MFRKLISRILALLFAGTVVGCNSDAVKESLTDSAVHIGLIEIQSSFTASEPVVVRYFLSNNTSESIRLLPWGTPLETPLTADRFEVVLNGQAMPYNGIMVKRMAPTDKDYVDVAAGETLEADVELSLSYDMNTAGHYTVQLSLADSTYGLGEVPVQLVSEPLKLKRTKR